MKSFVTICVVLCLAIIGGTIYLNHQKPPPGPAPVGESAPGQTTASADAATVAKKAPARTITESMKERVPRHFAAAVSDEPKSGGAADSAAFNQRIDALISHASSFQEKQAIWRQLQEAGQLDQAIEALKLGATNNPTSAEYPAALGKALFQKAGVVSRNGGSVNELGILGMSADQSFDNALKIDPANWDAQFYKAVGMSYWPAELNKGGEVIQRLSSLIGQQETMTQQPEFALPYIRLGDQYQKLGQTDNAQQTWQAGAAKFPSDPILSQRIIGK